jgi:CRP/FNR family transcriptional regulator, cyclic AMP receptor protein
MEQGQIDWSGIDVRQRKHKPGATIFAQGEDCASVFYVDQGTVRLSVLSHQGKEAVVGILGPGDFFGEGCLARQPQRMASATAQGPTLTTEIQHQEFAAQMLVRPDIAQVFLRHMLTRNIRIEEDLVDQLFNDAEKRLARLLLLMARFGEERQQHRALPPITQTILAEMVGTTRPRANAFMTKFRKLGFIEYNGAITVHHSLLTVLLREGRASASGSRSARAPRLKPKQRG